MHFPTRKLLTLAVHFFFGYWRGMTDSILTHMLELSLQPSSSWEFNPLTTGWHVWLGLSGMANLP